MGTFASCGGGVVGGAVVVGAAVVAGAVVGGVVLGLGADCRDGVELHAVRAAPPASERARKRRRSTR
jgi:hypothetical protein